MIIRKLSRIWIFLWIGLCFACSEGGEPEPPDDMNCMEDITIMADVTATAECGMQTGAIEVSITAGDGSYEYNLDGGNFTSNNAFTGLDPGNHILIVRDENNCRDTTIVLISSGISFSADVKPIIDTNCAVNGCHVAGEQQIPNFQVTDNILDNAGSIGANTSAGIMPPPNSGRSLTDEQIQILACWANDGGPNN